MKVEIKVLTEAQEPYAVIYANEVSTYIRQTADMIERAAGNKIITVT